MKQVTIEIRAVRWPIQKSLGFCTTKTIIVIHRFDHCSSSSIAVSIFALGGMIGGLFGGFITDRFGR